MSKLLLLIFCCLLLPAGKAIARVYTEPEARAAWKQLKLQPITESRFRETCDLFQDIAQTNLALSYEMLSEYLPMVKQTANRQWIHVLLMGWAKAKESLTAFDEAEKLYAQAAQNASGIPRNYNEVMVGLVLMYLEWGRPDSLEKYILLGEASCKNVNDRENLSFIYTFRAMSHMEDTAAMRKYLDSAIASASSLPDKNALFTAKYNRAIFYSQFNLGQQVTELAELLELAKDSSLSHKPRLYERTDFYFRSPVPSIYYQLMLVNLLLTDYDNASKFAELFYDATVRPNPQGAQAPNFNSVMAMVKAYQGQYATARQYLEKSRELFHVPEDSITYPTYQLAAGMIAEHEARFDMALHHFESAYKNGSMSYGLHLMPPEIYYAHELILNNKLDSAQKLFNQLGPVLKTRLYSAIGFYYYKYYSELLKAKNDGPAYSHALETFYAIKDSLAGLNNYRALQEVETKMRVQEKESQIVRLNEENSARLKEIKLERIFIGTFAGLAAVIIILLVAYGRNQRHRKLQAEQITLQNEVLQQNKIIEMEKQHRIEVMQGAIDAEENERHKIADQLHDEAGSMLALASLNISSVMEKGSQDMHSDEKIRKAHEMLTVVSASVRDISHRLTPLVIEKYGFRKSIEDMDHAINLSQKIKLETVIIGFEDDSRFPLSLLNNLFRIIQELGHNIVKHAQASTARIEIVDHQDQITIMAEDDGVGIADDPSPKGRGLQAMRSKIAYLNGKMEIMRKKDRGTLVVIEINTGK